MAPSPVQSPATKLLRDLVPVPLAVACTGRGHGAVHWQGEVVKLAWLDMLDQYRRHADLVPV